jgi:EmrB/QacA subfamily drug resistance transporter
MRSAPPSATTESVKVSARWVVAFVYVVGLFMSAMDNHIVNVMLPTLSRDFGVTLSSVQWTVISYVLSLAVVIPASAWAGDRYGSKRILLVALAIFTVGSAACGTAMNLPELVVCRVVQGVGGGMLVPVATAMLYRAYPPAERARMTRILIVPVLLGPVLAQPLGGLLVQDASWRWAFYLNVPIGIIAFIIGWFKLEEHRQDATRSFDVPGFILAGFGLSLTLYGVSQGPEQGWSSPVVISTGLVGLLALAAFVKVEARAATPLLQLSLLHDRMFRGTNIVNCLNTAAFTGLLFLAPVFLQEANGISPLRAGLTTFFTALGVGVASQTVGRIYPYVGPRRMAGVGNVCLAGMLLLFIFVGSGTSLWLVRGTLFLAGFANSATTLGIQTSMFSTVSARDTSSGSAIFNAGRQTSTAIGVAALTTVIASIAGTRLHAFHGAFIVAAGFALAAGIAAFAFIHDSDAAATMVRRSKSAPASPALATSAALPVDV